MRLDLKDTERDQSREGTCEESTTEEDGNSETKLAPSIEKGEVEDGPGKEPCFKTATES